MERTAHCGTPASAHLHLRGKNRSFTTTALKGHRAVNLNTAPGPIQLAVQNDANGAPVWKNDANGSQLSGSFALASLRIYDMALKPEQIRASFEAQRQCFNAVAPLSILTAGCDTFDVLRLVRAPGASRHLPLHLPRPRCLLRRWRPPPRVFRDGSAPRRAGHQHHSGPGRAAEDRRPLRHREPLQREGAGVAGASKANGAGIRQMDYKRAAHQQWEVAPFVGPYGDQSYVKVGA
jgi:hypothetical protein